MSEENQNEIESHIGFIKQNHHHLKQNALQLFQLYRGLTITFKYFPESQTFFNIYHTFELSAWKTFSQKQKMVCANRNEYLKQTSTMSRQIKFRQSKEFPLFVDSTLNITLAETTSWEILAADRSSIIRLR